MCCLEGYVGPEILSIMLRWSHPETLRHGLACDGSTPHKASLLLFMECPLCQAYAAQWGQGDERYVVSAWREGPTNHLATQVRVNRAEDSQHRCGAPGGSLGNGRHFLKDSIFWGAKQWECT